MKENSMLFHHQLNQSSTEVLQDIIFQFEDIASVQLIRHEVMINWGQKYETAESVMTHYKEALYRMEPLERKVLSRKEFLELDRLELRAGQHEVWSFTSKVTMKDGTYRHIAMMNFHPVLEVSVEDIVAYIKLSEAGRSGRLLESGRYFHYYGDYLLTEEEWIQLNARFLLPMILVRARYIGHRLRDGYTTLRLTNDTKYKPQVPKVILSIKPD